MDLKSINDFVSNAVNQYVVRPTGMPNQTGIAGFVFDILDEEMVSHDSEITDHYVEDNYAIQDHIALRPARISVRGFVGELSNTPDSFNQNIVRISQQITTIAGYATQFTTQAKSIYDALTAKKLNVGNVINQSISAYNLFDQLSTTANKQQNAYNYFYTLWASRILCSVETPYKIFTNMAIESIRSRQDGTTRYVSDFVLTFKEIRTVKTSTVQISIQGDGPLLRQAGRVDNLMADYIHGSQTSGTAVAETSSLKTAFQSYQEGLLS